MGETTPKSLRPDRYQDSLLPDPEDLEVVSEAVSTEAVEEVVLAVGAVSKTVVVSEVEEVELATRLVMSLRELVSQLATAEHRLLLLRDQVVAAALVVVVVGVVPEDLTAVDLRVDMIDLVTKIGPEDSEETAGHKVKDPIERVADLTWNRSVLAMAHAMVHEIFHAAHHIETEDTETETVALVVIAHATMTSESDPTKATVMIQESYEDTSFPLD